MTSKDMLKAFTLTLSGISIALIALPADAIAPGVDKIQSCGNFTANKYRVPGNQLTVKITQATSRGTYLSWTVKPYRASGYCLVNNANRTIEWTVERGPRPETVGLGPNEKFFPNLPTYGDVIVNRGQGATGDRQYFLVRPIKTGRDLRWYARCANNSDQIYDHTGRYVGYESRMRVLFPYVCEFSPLKPNPPLKPVKPQPR